MIVNFLKNKIKLISFILLICLEIYWFFLFLPLAKTIRTGLDPSWQYTISKAAQDGLMWGKDIIFTYGPWGYLSHGVALENNLILLISFRLIVHIALFVVFTLKIINLDRLVDKIVLASGFFLAFWLGSRLRTDYQIIFILLLILSSNKIMIKYLRIWALVLGSLSGFCLLTKFSLGIITLGSLTLFLLGNIYQSLRRETEVEVRRNIFALFSALFSAISVAFILFYPPYFLSRFSQIIFFLICSGLASILVFAFQKKKITISLFSKKGITFEPELISWIVFYLVYGILLSSSIINSVPSLIDYLTTSLQISSGYSSAMSTIPEYARRLSFNFLTLPTGLLGYFLSLITVIVLIKERSLSFALAVLFTLFISFKHGFVRQDGHVFNFSTVVLFVIPLCLTKIQSINIKKIAYLGFIYIIIMAIVFQCFRQPRIINNNFVTDLTLRLAHRLAPSYVTKNTKPFLDFQTYSSDIQKVSKSNLDEVKLSEDITNIVKNKTVDIIPWEISLVAANNLNWKPRPIFQSYSAYTEKLDNINFDSFSQKPRDYIFYDFVSIDGRHPFFDEPKTFSYVFCNYQPSSQTSNFVNTPKLPNLILLEKSKNRCLLDTPSSKESTSLTWNTLLPLETTNNAIIKANVDIQYSLLGKFIKSVFRVPPVTINVKYKDGTTQKSRIVPGNSINGIIVSHLPRKKNHQEVLSFLEGQLSQPVDSISFQNQNSLLYKSKININLSSMSIK